MLETRPVTSQLNYQRHISLLIASPYGDVGASFTIGPAARPALANRLQTSLGQLTPLNFHLICGTERSQNDGDPAMAQGLTEDIKVHGTTLFVVRSALGSDNMRRQH